MNTELPCPLSELVSLLEPWQHAVITALAYQSRCGRLPSRAALMDKAQRTGVAISEKDARHALVMIRRHEAGIGGLSYADYQIVRAKYYRPASAENASERASEKVSGRARPTFAQNLVNRP